MATNALLAWVGLLAVSGVSAATESGQEKYRVVCYVAAWATYRPANGQFNIADIDVRFCTHMIYSFAGLDNKTNTIRSLDPHLDVTKENFKKFVNLKEKKSQLKTMIAIGGWNEGGLNYSKMASSKDNRAAFVQSVVQFLSKHGFDGLDLDWEYPASSTRDGKPEDKENFVALVRELREEFDSRRWLLSAAIGAAQQVIDDGYDIPALSRDLDFINVMTYDYHGQWDKRTGHNAPLYGSPNEPIPFRNKNINSTINHLLALGAPPAKLNLGLPIYGRTFTLSDTADTSPGADAPEPGLMGPYTKENNFMGYNEMCEDMRSNKWSEQWDNHQKAPYAYLKNHWISYDNATSIRLKIKFLKDHNLGGAMVWSMDTDDFRGGCNNGSYPIMTAINDALSEKSPSINDSGSEKSTSTTTAGTIDTTMLDDITTVQQEDGNSCGFFYPSSIFTAFVLTFLWRIS